VEEIFPNLFYEAMIIPISKPKKGTAQQENCRSISLMNKYINKNINKIFASSVCLTESNSTL
jgi:hypothetical protein